MSWAVSAFSWTSVAKTEVTQHTCVFNSMWTFQPVRVRARLPWPNSLPPPPPPLFLSLIPDEAIWRKKRNFLVLTNNEQLPNLRCCADLPLQLCWRSCCEAVDAALYPTHLCFPALLLNKPPLPLLFCSLLFPPFSLPILTTDRRVLVCSCCFFDTFTPAPRRAAEEWELEVKQVWLTSRRQRGWSSG